MPAASAAAPRRRRSSAAAEPVARQPESIERGGWRFRLLPGAGELRDPAGDELIEQAMAAAGAPGREPLRRSRHACTYIARVAGLGGGIRELYVKLFEAPRGWARLKQLFRGSSAAHVAAITAELQRRGFHAPPLMLLGSSRLDGRTLIVTARAAGSPLPEVLAAFPPGAAARKRGLLSALGAEVGRLHRCGFVHGDLTPYNVFVELCGPRFILLDHDRTRRSARVRSLRRQLRNLVQLGRFELAGVTRTDRLRVLHAWAAARGVRNPGAAARRAAAMLAARLERDRAAAACRAAARPASRTEAEPPRMDATRVSVVIPAFNEAATIAEVVRRVLECGYEAEVIVVDDGSTDGTGAYLRSLKDPRVLCFHHSVNRGKGAALRLGFAAARNPFIVVQDADLEYDPQDYRALLLPLIKGRAEMAYGSRFLGGRQRRPYSGHYLINRLLTALSNFASRLELSDMETGMKAFRRDRLMQLCLCANRFAFEPEITVKAARAGWRICEVPISYAARGYEEGKEIGWRDGLAAVAAILYYRLFD